MEAHLRTCTDCQDEYQSLQALFTLRQTGAFPPVPEALNNNLYGLMHKVRPDLLSAHKSTSGIIQQVSTILAELIHDTAIQPQVVGLRGDSHTRQIAFVSDVADLDLEVSPADQHFLVVGQLGMDELPDDLTIRFVPAEYDPLTELPETTRAATISEHGYFRLTIEPGEWVVAVDVDDAVVLFPGVKF